MYRHGDVLIAPTKNIPEGAKKRHDRILAKGEITGHSHRIETEGVADLFDLGDDVFVRVADRPARVVHEEHDTITLQPGYYRVWRHREYTPEEIRVVRD